jgi:hypothetical protein
MDIASTWGILFITLLGKPENNILCRQRHWFPLYVGTPVYQTLQCHMPEHVLLISVRDELQIFIV